MNVQPPRDRDWGWLETGSVHREHTGSVHLLAPGPQSRLADRNGTPECSKHSHLSYMYLETTHCSVSQ